MTDARFRAVASPKVRTEKMLCTFKYLLCPTKALADQLSHRLVRDHDLIALEDLSPASHDAGWGGWRHCLEYKAEEAGIPLIAVDPSLTSQSCSGRGRLVDKTLAVRVHRCSSCGRVLDRGVNAARNILQLALDTLATLPARTGQAERNVTHRGVRALRSCPH
jgi:IS605 OrfB family transposase